MEEELSENIRSQILQYEPRAETQKVIVSADPDRYTLDVTVQFKLINTNEVVSVTTTLSRLR